MSITDRLSEIRQRIQDAALRAKRSPTEIRLLAVTKTVAADIVEEAIRAGVTDIGENRVQEAEKKFSLLTQKAHRHLIGYLQANKARQAIELFDYIHSVHS